MISDRRVVHEDIEPAKTLDGMFDSARGIVILGHIADETIDLRLRKQRSDMTHCLIQNVQVAIDQHDIPALDAEQLADGRPDSAPATSHDGGFSTHASSHAPSSVGRR